MEKNIDINGVKVRCAYDNLVDPKTLKPHPSNPNQHSLKQIDLYYKIVSFQGWRRAITVSNLSGCVTRGHGGLQMALQFGFPQVPVDYQDYGDEAEELADILADNQLAKLAELNQSKINDILLHLDSGMFDIELTAFNMDEIEKMMTSVRPAPEITFQAPTPSSAPAPDVMPSPSMNPVEMPQSHVRMVQLFLNTTTLPEFEKIVEKFKPVYNTSNTTDTVLEILRHATTEEN